ncbi:MAG TPA: hypothetical protein VK528_11260, partial [Flavobacterium sp.]|nr:hypothetical protein [Flavobacterium sp.]
MISNIISNKIRSLFKKPVLLVLAAISFLAVSCKTPAPVNYSVPAQTMVKSKIKSTKFMTGADNMSSYFALLKNKKVGILTNQTGLVTYDAHYSITDSVAGSHKEGDKSVTMHVVDFIVQNTKIDLVKIYAPEHGFRGTA